jgi:membrane-bound lytic murein transglycosylase A
MHSSQLLTATPLLTTTLPGTAPNCNTAQRIACAAALSLVLFGCTAPAKRPTAPAATAQNCPAPTAVAATPEPKDAPLTTPAPPPLSPQNNLRKAQWSELIGWMEDSPVEAFAAFVRSCFVLKSKPEWQNVCGQAAGLGATDETALRQFFKTSFTPYAVVNPDSSSEGTITGYY